MRTPLLLTMALGLFCNACGGENPSSPPPAQTPVPGVAAPSPGPSATPTSSPSVTPSPTFSPTPSPSPSPSAVTFTQVSQQILQPICVSCHSSFSNYAGVATLVTPGNPAASVLFTEVNSGSMPPSGPLTPEQIQLISDWISAGAINN